MEQNSRSFVKEIISVAIIVFLSVIALWAMAKTSSKTASMVKKTTALVNPVVNTIVIQKSWKPAAPEHIETFGDRNYIVTEKPAAYILTLEDTKKYCGKEVYDVNVSKEVFDSVSENDQIDKSNLQ